MEPNVSLNASADISGTIMLVEIINGTGILNIPGLNAGAYGLRVTVNSTMEYNSCISSTMFSVLKIAPTLEIIVDDIYCGEDATITINMPDDATGMVVLDVDGTAINLPIVNGNASTVIPGLGLGEYKIIASYSGDLNYGGCSNNKTFRVMQYAFSHLQTLINDDTTGEVTLDRDYYGRGSEITISKIIAINGNGHTLNANGLSRIFNVQSGNMVINNMTLANGYSESNGGAIYVSNGVCIVSNCCFINNKAASGGAIRWGANNGVLVNSTFTNNMAGWGAGVYWFAQNGNIVDCTFENNTAERYGGAVYVNGRNLTIMDSFFINNIVTNTITSWECGGAIYTDGNDHLIANSTFIANKAINSWGGAIKYGSETALYRSNEFYNNTALKGNSVYEGDAGNLIDNVFHFNSMDEIPTCVEDANLLELFENNVFKVNGNAISKKDYFNWTDVSMSIEANDISVGENLTVTVMFNESVTGYVNLQIASASGGMGLENGTIVPVPINTTSNINYTVSIVDGLGSVMISDLSLGKYTATAFLSGG